MSRARKIRNKFYISLEDAYELNEHIKNIFANVTMFQSKGFLSQKLFTAFKYEYGTRLLNYGFSIQNGRVVVPDEAVEDIQTYVDMFTQKFRVKYSALLESEGFDYNPLDNVDISENRDITRTPNLSGSVTDSGNKNSTRTDNLTDKETRNLGYNSSQVDYNTRQQKDELTHGESINTKNELTHGEKISTQDEIKYNSNFKTDGGNTYGKSTTTNTSSDVNTNSVVPYDVSNFSDREKNSHTETTTVKEGGSDTNYNYNNRSGKDSTDTTETHSGVDKTDATESHKGTDKTEYTGWNKTEKNITDSYTGTDETKHTGNQQYYEVNGSTRTTSSTGTETTDDDFTRTGFQPQYSISSRQDMIQKYRDVSNFSTVDIFLHDVADYILLSVFSTSPNLDCCLNNYL